MRNHPVVEPAGEKLAMVAGLAAMVVGVEPFGLIVGGTRPWTSTQRHNDVESLKMNFAVRGSTVDPLEGRRCSRSPSSRLSAPRRRSHRCGRSSLGPRRSSNSESDRHCCRGGAGERGALSSNRNGPGIARYCLCGGVHHEIHRNAESVAHDRVDPSAGSHECSVSYSRPASSSIDSRLDAVERAEHPTAG